MKSTVVPAQITSVEDRIAGNLTFGQVLLLIVPLLLGTVIYASFGPKLSFSTIKVALITIQFLVFGGLALRVNGKIIASWLIIYLRYYLRPRLYIFTKNDFSSRDIVLPTRETPELTERSLEKAETRPIHLSLDETIKIDQLLDNPSLTVSFALAKKGGVDVSLKPIKD